MKVTSISFDTDLLNTHDVLKGCYGSEVDGYLYEFIRPLSIRKQTSSVSPS